MGRVRYVRMAVAVILTAAFVWGGAGGTRAAPKINGPHALKIAYFVGATNNTYLQANIKAVKDTAKAIGASLHVYTANWDVTTQVNEMQSALSGTQYNAWAVEALDPNQTCVFIKQAIAKGIVVSVANQSLCGHAKWMPGTLTFVGGQTLEQYNEWLNWIFTHHKPGQVAILSGPSLNSNTDNFNAALKTQLKKHKGFTVVSNQLTDYTTETSFKTAQDILQAHPHVNLIIDNYSEIAQGVVTAVQQAGKTGKIQVYDYGGDRWTKGAIQSGKLVMTFPMLPYEEMKDTILALRDYAKGKKVPHFVNLVSDMKFPGAPFVTKKNVKSWTPEY
jgi:ribose transport system substrate-binding protein